MSGLAEGQSHANREIGNAMYLQTGDPGMNGGNQISTYTGTNTQPTLEQYENIFGPAARDIKLDQQRHKRHQRWHLPDALKGSNQYLTDRVDGLITDSTNSPFTRNILPYVYLENPDQKLKWNVYSFDEGIASRVPYESAARVLPQSKRSFAGYTVRQGLAIAMEHNFMVSQAGRENFRNQLTQLVGSIQMTNDLDVHVALLSAPSYQKHMDEKYYDNQKTTAQVCRQYVDLFGIINKIPNALDILIEDAKNHLKTWGSQPPTFLLCNGALTAQLTMIPEKTNYLTNGPDGLKRLADGPELSSYRGLSIIPTRKFSMDAGTAPRDLLRRRVRVAEYYRIPWDGNNMNKTYEFYDQSRDTMFRLSWQQLCDMADMGGGEDADDDDTMDGHSKWTFSKSGRDIVLRPGAANRVVLSEIVNDAVVVKSEYVAVANRTGVNCLTIPAVHTANGNRERKKRKYSDVRGQQLTSRSTRNGIKSNISLAQAASTINNPDYHETSETFGGGMFNDPLYGNDIALSKCFDSLKNPDKEEGSMMINWMATRSFLHASSSAQFNCPVLEAAIRDGRGDWVSGPAASTYGTEMNNKHARLDMFFKITLFRQICHPTGNHIVRTGAVAGAGDLVGEAGVREVMTYSDADLRALLGHLNNAARVNAKAADPNYEAELRTYFGLGHHEDMDDLLPPNARVNLAQTWLTSSGNLAVRNRIEDDTNGARVIIQRLWNVDNPNNGQRIYDANNYKKVFDAAVVAIQDYSELLTTWAGDIWFEKAMQAFILPAQVTRTMNDVIENTQAHACFDSMRQAIITDILAKHVQGSFVVNGDGGVEYKLPSVDAAGDGEEIASDQEKMDLKHLIRYQLGDVTWDNTRKSIYHNFLYDVTRHTEAGVIASNMQNINVNAFENSYQPNMHISRCTPASLSDMDKSASSMDESTWLIQQLACMMPLTPNMCDVLTSESPSAHDRDLSERYAEFLVGDQFHLSAGTYNTLLMHWFMSNFHPDADVRSRAGAHCEISDQSKTQLTRAMSQLLRQNKTFSDELEDAFNDILPMNYNLQGGYYCPGVAANHVSNLPSYVGVDDTRYVQIGSQIPYECVPIINVEATQPSKYTNNPALRTVQAYENSVTRESNVRQPDWVKTSYYATHGARAVESEAGKIMYNPYSATDELVAGNVPIHLKLPWTHFLNSHRDINTKERQSSVSGLTMNCYLMDHTNGTIDGHGLCMDICAPELTYMRESAAGLCASSDGSDLVIKHLLLILANRFWKPASRAMCNGAGIPLAVQCEVQQQGQVVRGQNLNKAGALPPRQQGPEEFFVQGYGCHLMHGPRLPSLGGESKGGGAATDIVILRPNIEHEMLGVIMGRGGTQELGATFWGQTELSCYDDSQHGIWGMSYKYHERAMVTNERNLVRVFDVAFDGYNGGMDQKYVKWGDPSSRHEFQQATYERGRAYNGPSMLVMKFPTSNDHSNMPWPNPIVFQPNMSGNATPDPEKGPAPSDMRNHMVFDASTGNCSVDQEQVYKQYMRVLGMEHWSTVDQSNKPAGDCCISNESASNMLAFQGTMKVYDKQSGTLTDSVQGSGHLGPSFVGVASVREGRGLMPAVGQPVLGHLM